MKLLTIKKPKVSIVLPTYNRADLLLFTIPSILVQDFADFELMVIDDGSTDTTQAVLNSFVDPRIVVVRQPNQGEYPATNNGLRLARGEYLTWIHSDDVWPQGTLRARVAGLDADSTLDFVHGDIQRVDEHGVVYQTLSATTATASAALQAYLRSYTEKNEHYLVHHTTIMFRRSLLAKAGFLDEALPYAGDFDWLLRALRIGKMQKVAGILYQYRDHLQSRRVTDKENGIDTAEVVRAILARYQPV